MLIDLGPPFYIRHDPNCMEHGYDFELVLRPGPEPGSPVCKAINIDNSEMNAM